MKKLLATLCAILVLCMFSMDASAKGKKGDVHAEGYSKQGETISKDPIRVKPPNDKPKRETGKRARHNPNW